MQCSEEGARELYLSSGPCYLNKNPRPRTCVYCVSDLNTNPFQSNHKIRLVGWCATAPHVSCQLRVEDLVRCDARRIENSKKSNIRLDRPPRARAQIMSRVLSNGPTAKYPRMKRKDRQMCFKIRCLCRATNITFCA
jgi:hypothetical protein